MFGRNTQVNMIVASCAVTAIAQGAGPARGQTDLRSAATELASKLQSDDDVKKLKGQRIVIAEFDNINGKGDAVPRIFQEMLTTEFIKQKQFKVVERTQLSKALTELKLGLSDLADTENVRRVGKIVGASYILLGSISDLGNGTNISARIVAIEEAESISAADVTIKAQDASIVSSGVNEPAVAQGGTRTTVDQNTRPPFSKELQSGVSLEAKANTKIAGTWSVPPANFGLLGGSNFVTEWSERLPVEPTLGFAVGDVYGDGSRELVTYSQDAVKRHLRIWAWKSNKFAQAWQSEDLYYKELIEHPTISVLPTDVHPIVVLGARAPGAYLSDSGTIGFRWDGSTFTNIRLHTNVFAAVASDNPIQLLLRDNGVVYLADVSAPVEGAASFNIKQKMPINYNPKTGALLVADVDNDSSPEIASLDRYGGVLKIFGPNGEQKAEIDGFATTGPLVSNMVIKAWRVGNNTTPYIVITENVSGESPDAGGYFEMIQFNGRSYERVWSSRRFGDEIVDIEVGDAKGEGKSGLLILSRTKNKYELTKIMPQ